MRDLFVLSFFAGCNTRKPAPLLALRAIRPKNVCGGVFASKALCRKAYAVNFAQKRTHPRCEWCVIHCFNLFALALTALRNRNPDTTA